MSRILAMTVVLLGLGATGAYAAAPETVGHAVAACCAFIAACCPGCPLCP